MEQIFAGQIAQTTAPS